VENKVFVEVAKLRQLTKLYLGICKPIKVFEEAFDLAGAREYYKRAAAQEHAVAQYNYAWMLCKESLYN